jgi:hypothetical protein
MAYGILAWSRLRYGHKVGWLVGVLGHLMSNPIHLGWLVVLCALILNVFILKVVESRDKSLGKYWPCRLDVSSLVSGFASLLVFYSWLSFMV